MTRIARLGPQPDRRAKTPSQERTFGLAYARAWRIRNRAIFDATFGPKNCACGVPLCG